MSAYQQAGTEDAGEPLAGDPLTEEQMQMIDEDRLQELGMSLAKKRDEWMLARASTGVEKRWSEEMDQYNGVDDASRQGVKMMDSVVAGYPVLTEENKIQRSTVYINITRSKTNAAIARVTQMLYPVDDRNWGLKPTPIPELIKAAKAEARRATAAAVQPPMQPAAGGMLGAAQPVSGQPSMPQGPGQAPALPSMLTSSIIPQYPTKTAQEEMQEAREKSDGMQDEIDEQLTECNYNAEGRLMLRDCGILGTGILKGPIVVNRVRKVWTPQSDGHATVHILEIKEDAAPASERVDIWNVFPDPASGSDPHTGRGIFERKNYTGKQLRELVKQPGYLKAQISKVLEEGPQKEGMIGRSLEQAQRENADRYMQSEQFELWEYWGEFSPDDLRAAGVDVPDGETEQVSGCVIMVNSTVIKGYLNPMETGDLPYDFMQWEKVDNSPWGYGVPHMLKPSQKVLNAAWRQMMDNSGASTGPQVIVNPQAVSPSDGRWEITGRKIWYLTDPVDPRTVFTAVDIPNHAQEFQQVIEMALKFADEESSIPMLAQGEKGNAPDTVGGMTILMNSSNVVLGRMVKQFDDCITRPHIRRYYDWNMCYNANAEIKGAFTVDARGTSALLVKDIQQQAMLQLGNMQGSGIIAPMVNWEEWFKQTLKINRIDPTDIMKSDAEIEALKNQPPQATPEQIRANTMLQVAQMNARSRQQVAQAKVRGEMAYANTEAQVARDNHVERLQELAMKRDLAILQYSQQHQMSIEQIKAELALAAANNRTQLMTAAMKNGHASSEAAKDRQHDINQSLLSQPQPPMMGGDDGQV